MEESRTTSRLTIKTLRVKCSDKFQSGVNGPNRNVTMTLQRHSFTDTHARLRLERWRRTGDSVASEGTVDGGGRNVSTVDSINYNDIHPYIMWK